MINLPVFIATLFTSFALFAQPGNRSNNTLAIGDTLPVLLPINNNKILNHPETPQGLPGLNQKLLILDFMTTACVPCIEALPRLDSLQQQFSHQAQIILVTPETKETVQNFLQKNRFARQTKLPIITEDTLLKSLFPHEYYPHEVWIDKHRIIKAITSAQYITADNMNTIIKGTPIDWPVKRDLVENDYNRLMLIDSRIAATLPAGKHHSAFTGRIPGIGRHGSPFDKERQTEFAFDSATNTERFHMINFPVTHMYLMAHDILLNFPHSRIILETNAKKRLTYDDTTMRDDRWLQNNTFCYEGVFPATMSRAAKKERVRADLHLYLGLTARLEKRTMKCLVLTKTERSDTLLPSTPTEPGPQEASTKTFYGTLGHLLYKVNHSWYGLPVIDETGYKKKYLQVSENALSNTEALTMDLEKYGLELREAWREVEVFVLSGTFNPSLPVPAGKHTNNKRPM